jgi:hypothetical protein
MIFVSCLVRTGGHCGPDRLMEVTVQRGCYKVPQAVAQRL